MAVRSLVRFFGVALLLAGVALLIWWLGMGLLLPAEGIETGYAKLVGDGDWFWINVIGLAAVVLLPAGLIGLYIRQAEKSGILGKIGIISAFVGSLLFACIQFIETVLWPIFAVQAPGLLEHRGAMFTDTTFTVFYWLMGILLASGFLILGTTTLRSRLLPKWGAVFMLVGGPLFCLAISMMMLRTLGVILLAGGFVWLGASMWNKPESS